jgi:2-hydroxy fatty acid dioxygenase
MSLSSGKLSWPPSLILAECIAVSLIVLVISAAQKFRNIEDALGFYGVYHREPLNQLIHFFGVPGIIWSAMIMYAHLPLPLLAWWKWRTISIPGAPSHPLSWAAVMWIFYMIFYLSIDPFGGTLYAPVVYGMYITSVNWTRYDQELRQHSEPTTSSPETWSWMGTGRVLKIAALIHLFSWYVQIHPGHTILEGAKPALMDSLGGALTSAPLFAFYEGLWFLGINKELQQKTLQLVAENTARLCAQGATMRVCS